MNSSPLYCLLFVNLLVVLVSLVVSQTPTVDVNGTTVAAVATSTTTSSTVASVTHVNATNVSSSASSNASGSNSTVSSTTVTTTKPTTTTKGGASQRYVLPTVAVLLLPAVVTKMMIHN